MSDVKNGEELYEKEMVNFYKPGGDGEKWKQINDDRKFEMVDLRRTWENVKKIVGLDRTKDFTFLSPSANNASHEIEILEQEWFERLGEKGKLQVVVGDLVVRPNLVQERMDKRLRQENANFQFINFDGRKLPIKDESVNMVWDRRGVIWYAAERAGELGEEVAKERLKQVIDEYFRVLEEGGVIVIDCDKGRYDGLNENSTVMEINRLFMGEEETLKNLHRREGPELSQLFLDSLEGKFEVRYEGIGKYKVAVLVKKSK